MDVKQLFGKEDIALLIIVVTTVGALWLFQPSQGSYQPSEFCKNVSKQSEEALSRNAESVSCECVSGDRYTPRQDTPSKVRNVTMVNDIVVCDVTANGEQQELVYPLLEINQTRYQELYNTTNTSNISVGGNARVIN